MLHLREIKLWNFKNYEEVELDFSHKINALVGLNGVGKTNILDAIHYLCLCKSNFVSQDKLNVRKGEQFFRIEGSFCNPAVDYGVDRRPPFKFEQIACVYMMQPKPKKTMLADGVAYGSLSEHIGKYPLVFIAPDDTRLLTEGGADRRQFLDATISQMDSKYLRDLMQYNRILEQRNALLKQGLQGVEIDKLLLIYARQLADLAAYIYMQRKKIVAEINISFQEYYRDIVAGGEAATKTEAVYITYESQLNGDDLAAVAEDIYLQYGQQLRRDQQAQRTTLGTHLDDFLGFIDGQAVKTAASQGQRKSYLLALKLAQYQLFRALNPKRLPLLLLDDIFDKLDARRIRHLLRIVSGDDFGQLFISDTNRERLEVLFKELGRDYKMWEIEGGKARRF